MRRPFIGPPLRGVYGSGQLGAPEHDLRGNIEQYEESREPERPAYCKHTGHDYWPRPCDACLARSERQRSAS